jgi:hypothetical protein
VDPPLKQDYRRKQLVALVAAYECFEVCSTVGLLRQRRPAKLDHHRPTRPNGRRPPARSRGERQSLRGGKAGAPVQYSARSLATRPEPLAPPDRSLDKHPANCSGLVGLTVHRSMSPTGFFWVSVHRSRAEQAGIGGDEWVPGGASSRRRAPSAATSALAAAGGATTLSGGEKASPLPPRWSAPRSVSAGSRPRPPPGSGVLGVRPAEGAEEESHRH